NEDVAGSATVLAIRGQIENTLRQFDPVDNVVIKIEGEEEGVLQP
ncbi:MAG: GerMN domain-containing protein, partial [Patescibacteria group bacterium]